MAITSELLMELTAVLEKHSSNWDELRAMFAPAPLPAPTTIAGTTAAAAPTPGLDPRAGTNDVDAKFVHATCEAIIASNCKLTRGGKEFVIQLRERASTYKSVRFSPKQWAWFNSIMLDAGIEAIDLPVEVK